MALRRYQRGITFEQLHSDGPSMTGRHRLQNLLIPPACQKSSPRNHHIQPISQKHQKLIPDNQTSAHPFPTSPAHQPSHDPTLHAALHTPAASRQERCRSSLALPAWLLQIRGKIRRRGFFVSTSFLTDLVTGSAQSCSGMAGFFKGRCEEGVM